MSAVAFQRALALLIRFPTETLDGVLSQIGIEALSEKERRQLEQMAADPLVRKFGLKMRYLRQRDAAQTMRLSHDYVSSEDLDEMFLRFESTRTDTDFVMLGVQFLEFLLEDPSCRSRLARGPGFLFDLLRYDRAKALVRRLVIRSSDPALPRGSLLRHRAFLLVDLAHDVATVDRRRTKDPASRPLPTPEAMKLIFLRSERPPYYRIFRIDEAIAAFLRCQAERPGDWAGELPEAYDGMAGVGLCVPRPVTT